MDSPRYPPQPFSDRQNLYRLPSNQNRGCPQDNTSTQRDRSRGRCRVNYDLAALITGVLLLVMAALLAIKGTGGQGSQITRVACPSCPSITCPAPPQCPSVVCPGISCPSPIPCPQRDPCPSMVCPTPTCYQVSASAIAPGAVSTPAQ